MGRSWPGGVARRARRLLCETHGLTHDELRYILDPKDVYGPHFPGETFRVLKEKEERLYGEHRTRRLVLEAWDRLEARGWKQEAGGST